MTNTTPESKAQSVSPLLQRAEGILRGQEFITAEATPEGLRLTGRKSLLGRTTTLAEDDVHRALVVRNSDGLRAYALESLIVAREPTKAEMAKIVEAESESQSIPSSICCAADYLRGQQFITAEATPEGLRLTGRKTLVGLTACMSPDDVGRAFSFKGADRRSVTDRLRDAAMWALVQSREAEARPESAEGLPSLQFIEAQLRGHPLFSAQIQGSGLALFANNPTRTAYLTEAIARAAHVRGGADEVARLALHALGWDVPPADASPANKAGSNEPVKVGDLHIDVTCATGPAIASLEALEAAATRTAEKLDSPAGRLGVLLAVIPVVSGAVAVINTEAASDEHERAAEHLVALVAKARKLALGTE